VRRLVVGVLAVVVALAAVVGLVAFLQARDDAGLGSAAPGVVDPSSGGGLDGDVVLLADDPDALRPLAEEYNDPGGPRVRIDRLPGEGDGVTAIADMRRLDATGPDDPALRAFIEYWLGR